jgi:xanthine dehydrogenase accessory factor
VLHVVGDSPVASALSRLAEPLGFTVRGAGTGAAPAGATAVLVCTHGGDEAGAVRAALDAGVGFVGVVCSRTRGQALLDSLGLDDQERGRLHLHVGVDIGARTAPEIALSILAGVVRAIRVDGLGAGPIPASASGASAGSAGEPTPREVVDPVCGMTVRVMPDTPHARVDGADYWFCNPGCRDRFVAEHAS